MPVGVFEKPNNAMISMCHNFGHRLYTCKNIEECFTRGKYDVVFCIDKQAKEELGEGYTVYDLKDFTFPKNPIFIFGKNTGMQMAEMIKSKPGYFDILTIDAPINTIFWVEPAMGIILYEEWKCTGTGKNQ